MPRSARELLALLLRAGHRGVVGRAQTGATANRNSSVDNRQTAGEFFSSQSPDARDGNSKLHSLKRPCSRVQHGWLATNKAFLEVRARAFSSCVPGVRGWERPEGQGGGAVRQPDGGRMPPMTVPAFRLDSCRLTTQAQRGCILLHPRGGIRLGSLLVVRRSRSATLTHTRPTDSCHFCGGDTASAVSPLRGALRGITARFCAAKHLCCRPRFGPASVGEHQRPLGRQSWVEHFAICLARNCTALLEMRVVPTFHHGACTICTNETTCSPRGR